MSIRKKSKKGNLSINTDTQSLAFNRLGLILLEIAQNVSDKNKFEIDSDSQTKKQEFNVKQKKKRR